MQQAHAEPNYIAVFIWLAALTVVEVVAVYLPLTRLALAAILVVLAFTKAALVALYFMHLKFERRTMLLVAVTPIILCVFLMFMLIPDGIMKHRQNARYDHAIDDLPLIWWGDVKTDGSAMAMIPTTPSEARQERLPHILLWSVLSVVLVGVVGSRRLVPGMGRTDQAVVFGAVPSTFAGLWISSRLCAHRSAWPSGAARLISMGRSGSPTLSSPTAPMNAR